MRAFLGKLDTLNQTWYGSSRCFAPRQWYGKLTVTRAITHQLSYSARSEHQSNFGHHVLDFTQYKFGTFPLTLCSEEEKTFLFIFATNIGSVSTVFFWLTFTCFS